MHIMPDVVRYRRMTTPELPENFLLTDLFSPGEVRVAYTDLDRLVAGGAIPTDKPLPLEADESLRAAYFLERREIGILNVGGAGSISVDGEQYAMKRLDMLYAGRGCRDVVLQSDDAGAPACYYLVSYPAHTTYPTAHIQYNDVEHAELGSAAQSNHRLLSKYIHPAGVKSCQLVMGVTELQEGSVWNTMPAHTHARRTEIYLYFDLTEENVVFHLMGAPDETRNLVIRNREAVLSPAWSVHAGAGTARYTFCWAMGGENQEFSDMQGVDMRTIA